MILILSRAKKVLIARKYENNYCVIEMKVYIYLMDIHIYIAKENFPGEMSSLEEFKK